MYWLPSSLFNWSANTRKKLCFFSSDSSSPEQTQSKITWTTKIQMRRIFHDNLIATSTQSDWDVTASQNIYVWFVFLHSIACFKQTLKVYWSRVNYTYENFFAMSALDICLQTSNSILFIPYYAHFVFFNWWMIMMNKQKCVIVEIHYLLNKHWSTVILQKRVCRYLGSIKNGNILKTV